MVGQQLARNFDVESQEGFAVHGRENRHRALTHPSSHPRRRGLRRIPGEQAAVPQGRLVHRRQWSSNQVLHARDVVELLSRWSGLSMAELKTRYGPR